MDPLDNPPLTDDAREEPVLRDEADKLEGRSGSQPVASLLSMRLRRRPQSQSAPTASSVRVVKPAPEPEPDLQPDLEPEPAAMPEPAWASAPESPAPSAPESAWVPVPEAPAPEAPPAKASAPLAPRPTAAAAVPTDIVDYWSSLRAGRNFPSPSDLDSDTIVSHWPNSILLTCAAGDVTMRAAALFKPLGAGIQTTSPDGPQPIDFSPMVVEWILSLAQDTVRRAQPLTEKELFLLPDGPQRYGACTLPLSADEVNVDHVLCYVRAIS